MSQGIAQVFPVFDVPNWAIRLIVVLIVIGFPVALVLAWAFELTPEGIKRTEMADAYAGDDATEKTRRGFISLSSELLFSIALFFLGRYSAITERLDTAKRLQEFTQKSIAVLPFDNLSRRSRQRLLRRRRAG